MTLRLSALLCLSAALWAQAPKPVLGTVTGFKNLEIAVKADTGETVSVRFGADTEVVQVTPGERDLSKSARAAVTDILIGDRVMMSFVPGMKEARRIVLITSRDIVARNEAEKADWQARGINGLAVAATAEGIRVLIRTPEGNHETLVTLSAKTNVRRYAPDSVKFTQALPAAIADVAPGDQVRARGAKSADGATLAADDIVFGTFLTRMGPIAAIRREQGEVDIQDVTTKRPLTVRIVADSALKKMPDMKEIMAREKAGGHPGPGPEPQANDAGKPFDLQSAIQNLPAATIDDLKVGSSIIVTGTRSSRTDSVTAIMLMANADFLVFMAQGTGEGGSDALKNLHGGMLVAPGGGISLPTMIQ